MLLGSKEREIPSVLLLFVSQYASHLYRSTFEKILVVVVTGMFPNLTRLKNAVRAFLFLRFNPVRVVLGGERQELHNPVIALLKLLNRFSSLRERKDRECPEIYVRTALANRTKKKGRNEKFMKIHRGNQTPKSTINFSEGVSLRKAKFPKRKENTTQNQCFSCFPMFRLLCS